MLELLLADLTERIVYLGITAAGDVLCLLEGLDGLSEPQIAEIKTGQSAAVVEVPRLPPNPRQVLGD